MRGLNKPKFVLVAVNLARSHNGQMSNFFHGDGLNSASDCWRCGENTAFIVIAYDGGKNLFIIHISNTKIRTFWKRKIK